MYRVRGADQNEYGPISADVVRDWFRNRRLVASSLIRLEGTEEWKPLSSFPEFADLLVTTGASNPPPISAVPAKPPQTSSLATSSLVLGILGFVTCGITAIIGLILGIVSTKKINRDSGRLKGKGLAKAGIIVSSVALAAVFVGGVLLPAIFKNRGPKAECITNLKQISLAARMYSMDHNNVFPMDYLSMSNELVTPKVLVCSSDSRKSRASGWSELGPRNISYEFLVPGKKEADIAQSPAFRCPVHGHVVLGDGSIQPAKK
ncbi:MAG: hypothetical protein JWM16_1536 [Verrucomicrobiales bacterium]|nr:hypothetical protein [Verrucomicrobiales bacterium]